MRASRIDGRRFNGSIIFWQWHGTSRIAIKIGKFNSFESQSMAYGRETIITILWPCDLISSSGWSLHNCLGLTSNLIERQIRFVGSICMVYVRFWQGSLAIHCLNGAAGSFAYSPAIFMFISGNTGTSHRDSFLPNLDQLIAFSFYKLVQQGIDSIKYKRKHTQTTSDRTKSSSRIRAKRNRFLWKFNDFVHIYYD